MSLSRRDTASGRCEGAFFATEESRSLGVETLTCTAPNGSAVQVSLPLRVTLIAECPAREVQKYRFKIGLADIN